MAKRVEFMPKTVTISLSGITRAIETAVSALKDAQGSTTDPKVKKQLAIKIKKLKAIAKDVKLQCRSHMVTVPTT
jgi:hypothetical protein